MPNSTTGMTSEHVMKIQQLTCKPTISVALVYCMYAKTSSQMGHFTWGALQIKSSLLTNEQFRGSSQCFFFSISHVSSKLVISHNGI
jgi:hypothetical protein